MTQVLGPCLLERVGVGAPPLPSARYAVKTDRRTGRPRAPPEDGLETGERAAGDEQGVAGIDGAARNACYHL